ncbi:MAG: hypothetical protein JSU03_00265 [Bacteroidetes bacterium]|nr:hypothetical protein [Bacteroidota bacterium]
MAFTIDELRMKNDTNAEQIRTRKIFETLKEKANKQDKLTEHEKNFFCLGVKLSSFNDGTWEDYPCCNNYKFKTIYLTYFRDLTGKSIFYKPKGTTLTRIAPNEAQQDLQYLYDTSDNWELVVQKVNHSEKLLQEISTETRIELKNLSNLPEFTNDPNIKNSINYIFKKRAILVQSKYIYCIALEILESSNPSDMILEINSCQIEFNNFSLVHILNRHFAEIAKQYHTKKSFHNEDFKPRILSAQLKEIFRNIDNSKVLLGKSLSKIGFRQNGIDYLVYTSEREKTEKGKKGNIIFRRLDTFFPVSGTKEKNILISKYELKKINQTLSFMYPYNSSNMASRIVTFVVVCLTIISCNRINPKDITIIDGVKLGSSKEDFYNQCDSLKIEQKIFYTKTMFGSSDDVSESRIKTYVTDIFNSSDYSTKYTQHFGLYYPTTLTGTKNIIGLNVLMVHTSQASLITNRGFENLNKETPGISQDISYNQVDDIANMLSKKYGKPSDTLKFEFLNFYVIEGSQIRSYHSDSTNVGEKIIWKTKYLDISLFKGIASPTNTFNSKDRSYMMYFDNNPYRKIDYDNGERPCYAYTYISYMLNEEAIKKLELDKAKL